MFVMIDAVQLQTQLNEISGLQASGFRLLASGPARHGFSWTPSKPRKHEAVVVVDARTQICVVTVS